MSIMKIQKFSMADITKRLKKAWTPINVETIDNFILRVAKFKGTYHWHKHENEDELFIVFKGKIKIQTNSGDITVNEGEGIKIPKGVGHCPISTESSIVMMFENSKLKSKRN